jgi:outer membrane protein assembly factor BamB
MNLFLHPRVSRVLACAFFVPFVSSWLSSPASAEDWPTWGGHVSRNMASSAKNLPTDFTPGKIKEGGDTVDMATTKNIKWVAKMGSQTYGNPTVSNGRVFVGTNNENHTDPRFKGDHSLLKCLDEKTGKTLWTLFVPKLGSGKVSDWEYLGICSSPTVDGDRVYVVTNRCEILCLDVAGLANGNDGEFKDEGAYMADMEKVAKGEAKPIEVNKETDADIIWRYDMRDELGIFPHNITAGSILVIGDTIYASTSNGVDWSHTNIPNPKAPSFIALDKKTGKLVGEEVAGMGHRIMHGGWSSASYGEIKAKPLVVFGGPDGFCYAFEPKPQTIEGIEALKEVWRYDGNPKHYRFKSDGKPIKYARPDGPSEFISSPVLYKDRVYAAIGQDPEHGEGLGRLSCIDASKTGDITDGGAIWTFDAINRSISTPAIVDDLVFIADFSGFVYCLDANTGELYWKQDTLSHIWASPLVADGKLYIGNEDGDMTILAADKGKDKKPTVINTIHFGDAIYSSAVTANGVIYIATMTNLYAVGADKK